MAETQSGLWEQEKEDALLGNMQPPRSEPAPQMERHGEEPVPQEQPNEGSQP